MSTRHTLLLASLFAFLPACQCTQAAPGFTEADRTAIHALDASFARLAVAGDYKALVELFYAEDALFLAPNAPAATGRAGIEAALRSMPPITKFKLQSDDIDGTGDLAYSRGRYALTMAPPGAPPIDDQGKSLVVLRRQKDGSWKAIRDMFNSDLPLPGAATGPNR